MSTKKNVRKRNTAAVPRDQRKSVASAAARRPVRPLPEDKSEVRRQSLEEIKRKHEKQKRRRRRRKRIILIVLVVILLSIGIFCLLFLTPFFLVQKTAFYGYEQVTEEEIAVAAAIPIGENTFKLKMSEIEKRIEKLPYVKDARVRRKLPDCINVMVFERTAVAYVSFEGLWYAIDEEGVVLEQFAACPEDHISLSGLSINSVVVGEKLELSEEGENAFSAAKEIIAAADAQELLAEITNLELSDLSKITFTYGGKYTVNFGTHFDTEQKMIYLKNVVSDGSVQMAASGSIRFDIDAGKAFFASGK
jgi:cell division protein FtsQ